jgi:hypothetical protein
MNGRALFSKLPAMVKTKSQDSPDSLLDGRKSSFKLKRYFPPFSDANDMSKEKKLQMIG